MTHSNVIKHARRDFMGKYYKPKFQESQIKDARKLFWADAGVICYSIINSLTRKVLVINDLYVEKSMRRRRIGSSLMGGIIKIAKKEKADCIDVSTKMSNKLAQKFYSKLGFKDIKAKTYRLWLK